MCLNNSISIKSWVVLAGRIRTGSLESLGIEQQTPAISDSSKEGEETDKKPRILSSVSQYLLQITEKQTAPCLIGNYM